VCSQAQDLDLGKCGQILIFFPFFKAVLLSGTLLLSKIFLERRKIRSLLFSLMQGKASFGLPRKEGGLVQS
jgi:hypothetical protein